MDNVETWHDTLTSIQLQYEAGKNSWNQIRKVIHLGSPPPERTPIEICSMIIDHLKACHLGWPGDTDPPERYRIRGGVLSQVDKKKKFRTHMVKPSYGPDGEVIFVDATDEAIQEHNAAHIALQFADESAKVSLRCLESVSTAIERMLSIAAGMEKMAVGAADLAQKSASGLAEVIKAQGENDRMRYEHEEEIARMESWGKIGEQFAGPLASQIASFFVAKAAGSPGPGAQVSLPQALRSLRKKAGKRWDDFSGKLTADERSMVEALLLTQDDDAFIAIFLKLREQWNVDRLNALLPQLEQSLGIQLAQELAAIIAAAESRAGGTHAAA